MPRSRCLLLLLVCLVPLGLFGRRVPSFMGELLGNIAYLSFFSGVFALLFPRARPSQATVAAFLLTCLIEVSQASSHPILEALRRYPLARLVLGTTYSPLDFLSYALSAPLT